MDLIKSLLKINGGLVTLADNTQVSAKNIGTVDLEGFIINKKDAKDIAMQNKMDRLNDSVMDSILNAYGVHIDLNKLELMNSIFVTFMEGNTTSFQSALNELISNNREYFEYSNLNGKESVKDSFLMLKEVRFFSLWQLMKESGKEDFKEFLDTPLYVYAGTREPEYNFNYCKEKYFESFTLNSLYSEDYIRSTGSTIILKIKPKYLIGFVNTKGQYEVLADLKLAEGYKTDGFKSALMGMIEPDYSIRSFAEYLHIKV